MSDLCSISRKALMLLPLATLLILSAPVAQANSIAFTTGPTVLGGFEVNFVAQFQFDTTNHKITITLLNYESDPYNVTQALGSIRFNLTGAGSTPTPTLNSFAGSLFGVDANGNPTTQTETPHWTASNIGSTMIAFCTTCATGGVQNLVIGGPGANGVYNNANGGIKANNAHNPFIIGSDTTYATGALAGLDTSPSWVITVPTMTAAVTVTSVTFGFGTGTNYGTTTILITDHWDPELPEPGSVFTMMGGLGLILFAARKYRPKRT